MQTTFAQHAHVRRIVFNKISDIKVGEFYAFPSWKLKTSRKGQKLEE